MFKSLSKSTWIMFLFDLIILCLSTFFVGAYFGLSQIILLIATGLVVVVGLGTLFLKGNYRIREFRPTFWNFYRMFEGMIFTHIPVGILLYFFVDKSTLIKFLGINILIIYCALCIYRFCFHYYLFNFKTVKKILIVGVNERAKALADEIMNKPALRMEIVGLVRTDAIERKILEMTREMFHLTRDEERILEAETEQEELVMDDKVPVFEDGRDIYNIVQKTEADIVIFTYASQLMSAIPRGVKEYLMPQFYEMVTGKFYMDFKNAVDFRCDFSRKNTFVYDFLKRTFDIISALIILIVTLPITAYIAIRVKLTDGASPFFSQTRVGQDGKTFECYKLRTMYVNDYVPKDGEDIKYAESVKGDDRIIPFCRFVRKARFDEIPQMINILKGEMSIVGPRAEWANEAAVFEKEIPFYTFRNFIRAGWTGWSHISMGPCFSVDDERERLAYDLYYIKHRNVFWDIAILVKAVFLACGGRHK